VTTALAAGPAAQRTGRLAGRGLLAAARTDPGPRKANEDAFLCQPDLGLFAVIDGMGGQKAGETAAAVTRGALLDEPNLVRGVELANERVRLMARGDPALSGMGCVVSALRVKGTQVRIAHVGDTRVYLCSEAGCEQLTRDHTVAARAQEALGLPDQSARELSGHNQVTRDVGGQRRRGDEWIDRLSVPLAQGDVLLLCSDGLHGAVPSSELFVRLRKARREGISPEEMADELVDLALQSGTRDNVTAVVVRQVEAPSSFGLRLWRFLNTPLWGRDGKGSADHAAPRDR
jgi:PPM family protein phosphatase